VDALIAQLLTDTVLYVGGELVPQVRRVAQIDLAIVYPQVDGTLGLAVKDDAIKAGEL
jgi:hypothetical protein